MGFKDYFYFKKLIIVDTIQILHLLVILACIIALIALSTKMNFFLVLIGVLVSYLVIRIIFEQLILTANIYEEVRNLSDKSGSKKK